MGFRPSKIVVSIHAGDRRPVQPRHPDREAAVQRPELLQPLDALERVRRQRHPAREGRTRVRVDADVLHDRAVEQLAGDGVVEELMRMLGAESSDGAARKHAEKLLAAA